MTSKRRFFNFNGIGRPRVEQCLISSKNEFYDFVVGKLFFLV